jgi:hypothetical protein
MWAPHSLCRLCCAFLGSARSKKKKVTPAMISALVLQTTPSALQRSTSAVTPPPAAAASAPSSAPAPARPQLLLPSPPRFTPLSSSSPSAGTSVIEPPTVRVGSSAVQELPTVRSVPVIEPPTVRATELPTVRAAPLGSDELPTVKAQTAVAEWPAPAPPTAALNAGATQPHTALSTTGQVQNRKKKQRKPQASAESAVPSSAVGVSPVLTERTRQLAHDRYHSFPPLFVCPTATETVWRHLLVDCSKKHALCFCLSLSPAVTHRREWMIPKHCPPFLQPPAPHLTRLHSRMLKRATFGCHTLRSANSCCGASDGWMCPFRRRLLAMMRRRAMARFRPLLLLRRCRRLHMPARLVTALHCPLARLSPLPLPPLLLIRRMHRSVHLSPAVSTRAGRCCSTPRPAAAYIGRASGGCVKW